MVSLSSMHAIRRAGLVAGLCAALLLTACGGDDETGTAPETGGTPQQPKDTALAAMVPADIASDGVITVGTDATYAPNEFLAADGKTVQGFDIDLFDAVAQKLGLETEYVSAPFANIIPSVQSAKYEIGVSSFTINPERTEVVDMISYFSAGTQWATQKGNPTGIQPDDACGKRVAVQKATVQVEDVTARSDECAADGKPAIKIDQYQGQDTATSSVVSGKDDAMLADSPVAQYAVQQTNGALETLGDIYDSAPYGYAVKKGTGDFAQALADAVNTLIEEGTYQEALDKWGVGQGAITTAEINP